MFKQEIPKITTTTTFKAHKQENTENISTSRSKNTKFELIMAFNTGSF